MFDIGFSEMLVLMLVTLLVVGPERLPAVAKRVGLWIGKARRFVRALQVEIDKELATEELKNSIKQDLPLHEIHELKAMGESAKEEISEFSRYHPNNMMQTMWPGQEKTLTGDSLASPPATDERHEGPTPKY